MQYLRLKYYLLARFFIFLNKSKFKHIGNKVRIVSPLLMEGMENIIIYDNVRLGYKCWLSAKSINIDSTPIIEIGAGSRIGNFCHIISTKKISFGKKVLVADKVYISDNLHSYEDISIPIVDQEIKQINEVIISDGAWIGENVCVLGAKIGKNSVVGANSVVTKDIPDYCVAVGTPARIIKKYNIEKNIWENAF